jgi:hypothetical protein
MRQDPNSRPHQQPWQWQIPRQRVPYEESGSALNDCQPAPSWFPFDQPMRDLTTPAGQRSPHRPDDGQPAAVTDARPDAGLNLGEGIAYAISLALAVSAALVFFVSLASRQLNIVTVIVTVALMLAALANHWCLARQR